MVVNIQRLFRVLDPTGRSTGEVPALVLFRSASASARSLNRLMEQRTIIERMSPMLQGGGFSLPSCMNGGLRNRGADFGRTCPNSFFAKKLGILGVNTASG